VISRRRLLITAPAAAAAFQLFPGIAEAFQQQTFTSQAQTTKDLHNVTFATSGPQDPDQRNFANAGFHRYRFTVTTGSPEWTFVGDPWVVYVGPGPGIADSDARAGFAWNNFGVAHDRVYQISRNATAITYDVWAGSHAMQIALACNATKSSSSDHAPHERDDVGHPPRDRD
jgi:hypothetical protein